MFIIGPVNILLLAPAIVAFIGTIISVILLYGVYKERKFVELKLIMIGFVIYSIHPLVFSVFSFLGEDYEELRMIFGVIQLNAATFGFLLVWFALNSLTGDGVRGRKYILVVLTLFGLGYASHGFETIWDSSSQDWVVSYTPEWSVALIAVPLLWIMIEIIIISLKSISYASSDSKKIYILVFVGWIFGLLTVIALFAERILGTNSAFYLVMAATGFVIFSISLRIDPYAMVPRTIQGQSLVISNRLSGLPLVIHNFLDPSRNTSDESILFSGAMKGILTLLTELTGREDLPEEFGYVNYAIVIEKSPTYIAYFICYRVTNPVKSALADLLTTLEVLNLEVEQLENWQIDQMHKMIGDKLYFAV